MPNYEFLCDDCEVLQEAVAPIEEGPPQNVRCPECGAQMYQNFGCEFILQGAGWPGKEAKEGEHYHLRRKAREQDEERAHDHVVAEQEAEEVMAVRQQGREVSDEHRKKNPRLWKRYSDNLRKGIGKKAGKKK